MDEARGAARRAARGRDRTSSCSGRRRARTPTCSPRRSAAGWRRATRSSSPNQDHEANSGVWRRLADDGIEVREWRDRRGAGTSIPPALARLLDGRVRLVAFPHCLERRRRGQRRRGDRRDGPRRRARSSASTGSPTRRTGCRTSARSAPTSTCSRPTRPTGRTRARWWCAGRWPRRCRTRGTSSTTASPAKRLTPAGPDHAQVAACAGIADYVEALHARHFADAAGRAAARRPRPRPAARARDAAARAAARLSRRPQGRARFSGPRAPERRVPTVAIDLGPARRGGGGGAGGARDHGRRRALLCGAPARARWGSTRSTGVLRLSFVHYTQPRRGRAGDRRPRRGALSRWRRRRSSGSAATSASRTTRRWCGRGAGGRRGPGLRARSRDRGARGGGAMAPGPRDRRLPRALRAVGSDLVLRRGPARGDARRARAGERGRRRCTGRGSTRRRRSPATRRRGGAARRRGSRP